MDSLQTHRIRRIQRISWWLDDCIEIPLLRIRIGLDPLLGLLPGAGDLIAAALGLWLVIEAARAGIPSSVITRMLGNIALDTLVGMVPAIGDLFDFWTKANRRNARLVTAYLAEPERVRRGSRRGVALAACAASLLLLLLGLCVWLLIQGIGRLLST